MGVRREKVVLEVESNLASTMARDAAATKLLARELHSLSGQSVQTSRATEKFNQENDRTQRSTAKASATINQLTGRLRLMADVAAILGPALVPIGAVALPAVMGLANQFGVAALAGGVAVSAFQGVGAALEAVNKAALEPTAENLNAAREALELLSPAAQDMVQRLQELRPVLTGIRDAAAEGLFPGVLEGFDHLESRVGDIERIFARIGEATGEMFAEGMESLASDRWDEFFDFLATEAPRALSDLSRTVGSLAHGFSELWMAFTPLNRDFSGWLLDVSQGFDSWAAGLSRTEGFRDFIDYVRENGPQVADTFGALANAVLQVVEASAPLGGPVLAALEGVANVIAAIADSGLGTPLAGAALAFAAWNRSAAAWSGIAGAVISGFDRVGASTGRVESALSGAARAGGIAVGALILNEVIDSWDDAELSARRLERSLTGLALGAVGRDLDNLTWSAESFGDALHQTAYADAQVFGDAGDEIAQLDEALAQLAENSPRQAERAWRTIVDQGTAAGVAIEDLKNIFPELQTQLDITGSHADDLGNLLVGGLAPGARDAGRALGRAAGAAQTFSGALAVLNGFLDKREALRNYQQALDDFRKSIKENGNSFDRATEKGRANEAALDAIADRAIVLADHLKGLNRQRTLSEATKDIRALAKDLGIPQREVEDLIDRLQTAAKTDAKPKVEVQGAEESGRKIDDVTGKQRTLDGMAGGPTIKAEDNASGIIGMVASRLTALNGDTAHTYVITHYQNQRGGTTSSAGGHSNDSGSAADGGTVPKTGRPYADRHPYLLADGEEVISNRYGQADRNRALLKAINANRMAAGGTVRSTPAPNVNVSTSTGPLSATVVLTDDQFQRLEKATERGARAGIEARETASRSALAGTRRTGR